MVRGNKKPLYLSFWYTETAIAGKISAALFGGNHFIWLQGQDARPGNPYVKRVGAAADHLIALSAHQAQEFQKNYKISPGHIITSAIIPERFPPFNTDKRPIDLIAVGSLIPLKNHTAFIQLVKVLKPRFPAIRAEITGEGPERERLAAMINSFGLAEHVRLTGSLPHQAILKKMAQSKILVHTSLYEGYGTVIPEALYSGCYVIAKFSPESQPVKNLFICGTHEAMVEQIIELLHGNTSPERVLIRSMDEIADQLMAVFTSENNRE